MKIVMLIDTLNYGGGAERQFSGLAISLHKKKGYNVKVLAYHPQYGYQKELEKAGVEYKILPLHNTQLKKLNEVRKQFSIEKPDLVISFKDGPNNIACILKLLGAKWKLIVSDRNTQQGQPAASTKIQYQILYRFADAIVPNSFAQKEFIDTHYPALSKKVCVITNFTDTDIFHPKQPLPDASIKKQLLIVARIAKQKNVLTFLETVHLLAHKWKDKAHITWYGNPNVLEDEYAQQCYSRISEYEIQDFFEFHEPVSHIEQIYRTYDAFCLPSLWEGFPNVLCEAMASGLAVCASRICDNERIITDGQNGLLFNPTDPTDMASKIDTILSIKDEELCRMGHKARAFTLENLSKETFTNKYISLINQVFTSCR